ncbi:TIGR03086 family metal-binding protein [Micromonospora sp. WMMD812]|uniref:TIGR03086 family metal-binding protein n=1 Tax=Micromonospora sp. WMMD812 TaxID=3015152 RepID=UPI00248B9578|nr:TIGR03086 family metal-binding protein [Micromonospora sp. WMMD812]WBB67816.1 TIGR03086 family metal-binding protein [Micromonospora sp. WMMD812]
MPDTNTTPDLEPASRAIRSLVLGVTDDQLTLPTPCDGWLVGDLLDHLVGLTVAFRVAAEKAADAAPDGPPNPSMANLDPAWRAVLPAQLADLTAAWRKPSAWTGETAAGGVVLPAEIMGVVALDELVIHGWDLARATGQRYEVDPQTLESVHSLVSAQQTSAGAPGLFGPPVPMPTQAPLLDRVVGLTGRNPAWPARTTPA